MPKEDIAGSAVRHVIFLVHGIRTQGEWATRAAAILEAQPGLQVRPIRYGFFDTLRFLIPGPFRNKPVRRVTRLIRDELSRGPVVLSIIAHSFGTYILGRILQAEPDLRFKRVLLCGSILPDDFEWENFGHRIAADNERGWQVVNDCGMQDIWPVLAQSVTWGYGSSGRFGFGHPRVKDRFYKAGHSGFFSEDFVRANWLPYFTEDKIVDGVVDRPTNSLLISLLTVLKLPVLAGVSMLIAAIYMPEVLFSSEFVPDESYPTFVDDIYFGDNTSSYAFNDVCDDPGFTGTGMAAVPVEEARYGDASDCSQLYSAGAIQQVGYLIMAWYRGDLATVGEIDEYAFDATEGTTRVVDLRSTDFDAYLTITSPTGVVFSGDDHEGYPHARVEIGYTETGTYRVQAASYANSGSGNYTLSLTDSAVDANDFTLEGDLAAGDLTDSEGRYYDTVVFEGIPGQEVSIDLTSPDFDTYVLLDGPDGALLANNDDFDPNYDRNSRIVQQIFERGTYTIRATSYPAETSGHYVVSVTYR